ncbi:MAG: RidA family protein [Bacteroidales bacterium]
MLYSCSPPVKEQETLRRVITLDSTPSSRPYSPAVEVNNTLYISGQIAIDTSTGKLIKGGLEEQTRQALNNLKSIAEKAGYKLKEVVKCTVLLTDIEHYSVMNRIYIEFFPSDPPARMAFAVKDLPMGALVEIEAVTVK